jgi:aspartate/methionine/tyrosine aminotransferase
VNAAVPSSSRDRSPEPRPSSAGASSIETSPIWFPYMTFARGEASSAPWSLTQSGMPPADPATFAELGALDLSYAGASALPELRGRIARRYGVPPERVIVTPGASGAMSVLAHVLFGPGVRVAVETPSYEPLRALPRRAGAEVREIERRLEHGWRVDPAEVEAALAGASTGHVSVTTPHNPSGARIPAGTLRELAALAARSGGCLISNEIYEEYVPPELAVRAARLAPNAISLGSLTKAYGLGALRVGWIVLGEAAAAHRAAIEDATYLEFVDLPTFALKAGALAWKHEDALREPIRRVERETKPLVREWLAGTGRLRALVPDHGVIAFAEVEGVADTLALQRHLAAEHGVGVVSGEHFGCPGAIRIGFGGSPERVAPALERLRRGLDAYRGR